MTKSTTTTEEFLTTKSKDNAEQVTRFTQGLNLKQQDLLLTCLRGVEFGTFMATKKTT